jgi:hypothetical protein
MAGTGAGKAAMGLGTISAAANMVDKAVMGDKNFGAQSAAIDTAVHGVSSALMQSGNPYAMAAGVALKIIDKTGGFTDASRGLGGANDTLNAVAALALPGAGWFTSRTENYKISSDTKSMASGYASAMNNAKTAQQNAGAKILFGAAKANSMIRSAKVKDKMISNIKKEADESM